MAGPSRGCVAMVRVQLQGQRVFICGWSLKGLRCSDARPSSRTARHNLRLGPQWAALLRCVSNFKAARHNLRLGPPRGCVTLMRVQLQGQRVMICGWALEGPRCSGARPTSRTTRHHLRLALQVNACEDRKSNALHVSAPRESASSRCLCLC